MGVPGRCDFLLTNGSQTSYFKLASSKFALNFLFSSPAVNFVKEIREILSNLNCFAGFET